MNLGEGINTSPIKRRGEQGGVLVSTFVATFVVGLVLTGYMTMVGSSHRDSVRSETWNAAISVAESGLEEALAHLQKNFPANLLSQGWTLDGTNVVRKRKIGDSYYKVSISANPSPVVVSSGHAAWKSDSHFIERSILLQTSVTGLVTKAFATKYDIKLNGNDVRSDSYDSTDPLHSDANGQYDPNKTSDNGDISTNLGTLGALNAGNANIKGRVATGPDGSVTLGPNTVVGSSAWHSSGTSGAEPGWVSDDANVVMPSVESPSLGGAYFPGTATVNGTNYNHVMVNGKYVVNRLSGSILVSGDVELVVTEQLSIGAKDIVRILPGSSLKMYVAAPRASFNGQALANDSGRAENFVYLGLPSNTQLSLTGGSTFYGVVYAPDTDLHFTGGGSIFGAVVGRSADLSGNVNFHFDESLRDSKSLVRIIILGWDEV